MGDIPISAKNFTHIKIVLLAFNKPALVAVIPAPKVVRPGIGKLFTRVVDNAQIRQTAESLFQVPQDLLEMIGVGQPIITDFIYGESQGVQPFLKKEGYRSSGV